MDPEAFLSSLRDDILDPLEYLDVKALASKRSDFQAAIERLSLVKDKDSAVQFLRVENNQELASLLLGTDRASISANLETIASVLAQWKVAFPKNEISGIIAGLILSQLHSNRGRRARAKFEHSVGSVVASMAEKEGLTISRNSSVAFGVRQRQFDYVINSGSQPIVVITSIYQTSTGGRQTLILRDLPLLQQQLAQAGKVLLVIAEGSAFKEMARQVRTVAPRLNHFTNLKGLNEELFQALSTSDQLLKKMREAEERAKARVVKTQQELDNLSLTALRLGNPVNRSVLGLDPDESRRYLLDFRTRHPWIAFDSGAPDTLVPRNAQAMRGLRDSSETSDLLKALHVVADIVGGELTLLSEAEPVAQYALQLPELQLRIPNPIPFFISTSGKPGATLTEIDRRLTHGDYLARIALLVDTKSPAASRAEARRLAADRRSQVAVLDTDSILSLLLRVPASATAELIGFILKNVDLTFVSPFVSDGPTPENMFFGRDLEIKRIVEQVKNQSFALIGGRKAGKTSILRRLKHHLPTHDFAVEYVDCEAHPDRLDFLQYLTTVAGVAESLGRFGVKHSERVLRASMSSLFGDRFGVFLLDEVDDLFLRDSQDTEYPHLLSRALRAISQERLGSIVVTGERALYSLTNDATSPHWNFCTPLQIGPLTDEAAKRLIREPLQSLQISIDERAVANVLLETANHPNLLQYMGTKVVESVSEQAKIGEFPVVGVETINDLVNSADYRKRFVRTYLSQATPLEKLLAAAVDMRSALTIDELVAEIRALGAKVDGRDLVLAVGHLELYSIVNRVGERVSYRADAFWKYFSSDETKSFVPFWVRQVHEP